MLPSNTQVGRYSKIERGCTFSGFKVSRMGSLKIGDCSFIGEGYRIRASQVKIGDYVKLHNHGLIMGPSSCEIGHSCWVGERTVLNCHAPLRIGNNVQIGMENHIWTHVIGELFEGSTLRNFRPVTIESNAWLCGNGIVICPGVTLARGTVILPNSVVAHSTQAFHCYAGNPAKDITRKVQPWKHVSLKAKLKMMQGFVQEFRASKNWKPRIRVDPKTYTIRLFGGGKQTVFDIRAKTYTKTLSRLEREFMQFLIGDKARFIPEGA